MEEYRLFLQPKRVPLFGNGVGAADEADAGDAVLDHTFAMPVGRPAAGSG